MVLPRVRAILADGVATRAYPAAVCEVGRRRGPLWRDAVGRLTYAADAPPTTPESLFDLASLTKVITTTTLAMRQVEAGVIDVETPVTACLSEWRGGDRDAVTIGHLLDHSSGLPAHVKLWPQGRGREVFLAAISDLPLERPPGVQSVYSDVGFMLLGFALEAVAGASLDHQWEQLWPRSGPPIMYRPARERWPQVAPTEDDPWRGHVLQGEVHDENAAALGGVAAHAGLFGTAAAVGVFAATVLDTFTRPTWLGSPARMRQFAARTRVPGSSRALGWDTMRPTSSCGPRLSPTAIGHTGFTGTSVWIDWERDLYVVLLTNRVHPTRANERFRPMRALVHTAVIDDLE